MSWIKQHERRLIYSQGLWCSRAGARPEPLCSFTVKIPPQKKKAKNLVLRGASSSPVKTPPAPHQSPVFCKMSLSAPLAASALIIGEKTESGTDIALADTIFALRAGRANREEGKGTMAFTFSSSHGDRFCRSWVTSGQFEREEITVWPLTYWTILLMKALQWDSFFLRLLPFFFPPLNLYKRHTWIRPRRLPLLLMPSFIRNLFFYFKRWYKL